MPEADTQPRRANDRQGHQLYTVLKSSPADELSATVSVLLSTADCVSKMDPRVRKLSSLMARKLHQDFNLAEVAQTMNLSTSRLRHIFKKDIGLSPRQYLKAQRIERARQLLETTYFNVKEIMLRVGIRDQSHFTRSFKSIHGFSPAQYRKQHLAQITLKEVEADSQIGQLTAKTAYK